MKSRIKVFILAFIAIALCGADTLLAQRITTNLESKLIEINSEEDLRIEEAFRYKVNIGRRAEYDDWALQVRVNPYIVNSAGESIDPSRIKIQLMRVDGGPSLGKLKANRNAMALTYTDDLYIIREADEDLERDSDFSNQWVFVFDIIIEGGDNLKDINNGEYSFDLAFWMKDEGKRIINGSEANSMEEIHVNIPDNSITFGFEVFANATLDFTSPEHFTMQVENNPNNSWIDVTSKNSNYFIKVKANDPDFQLIRNDAGYEGDSTIPVGVVNVEIDLGNNRYGQTEGPKPLSSTTAEILFTGKKKQNEIQKLPVRYFITKEEAEKLGTKTSGQYRTILTYTLEPN